MLEQQAKLQATADNRVTVFEEQKAVEKTAGTVTKPESTPTTTAKATTGTGTAAWRKEPEQKNREFITGEQQKNIG